MFEESLHIARRTQFFILLSAVIFSVFALSVQPLNKLYNRALSQVETAISIEWDTYPTWVAEKFKQAKSEFDNPVTSQFYFGPDNPENPIEKALDMMDPFIQTHHLELQNRELLTELQGEINFANKMTFNAETILSKLTDPLTNSPLDIIRLTQSADALRNATMYSISRANTEQGVWETLYKAIVVNDRYKHELTATKVNFSANATLVEHELNNRNNSEELPWSTFFISIDADWITPDSAEGIAFNTKRGTVNRTDIEVEADKKPINQSSIVDWLAETYPGLGLSPEGQLSPFYGIEHVWREIADRPLSDAALYVHALAAEERRHNNQVNVFGVNIPAQLVPIAGPLTILILVCYLSRIITHIQVHAGKHGEVLSEFPWLVLNAKNIWWLDPLFSFFVFPVTTQYIIMSKLKDAGMWIQLGWIFTALTLLVGTRVWRQLNQLRMSKPGLCK
jgi:hypothetical protein